MVLCSEEGSEENENFCNANKFKSLDARWCRAYRGGCFKGKHLFSRNVLTIVEIFIFTHKTIFLKTKIDTKIKFQIYPCVLNYIQEPGFPSCFL